MKKRHFIALADTIRTYNSGMYPKFTEEHIRTLASFCASTNPRFDRERWLSYIAGECGPNGGKAVQS